MKIILFLFAGLMVVGAATWTYQINYRTQSAMERVSDLQLEIAAKREAIAVLHTEWAYLNRPERLRALAETYFNELRLMPIHANHFGAAGQVSFPMQDQEIDNLIEQIVVRGQ